MKLRGIVENHAFCIPKWAIVVGCAVELDESFVIAYSGIEEGPEKSATVLGFNHDDVDLYCNRFHEYDMIFPLWQYKCKRLTDTFEIARIHYEGSGETMTIEGDNTWKSCPFQRFGKCSAFAYWVDYHLPIEKGLGIISTGDSYHNQAIRMLPTPILVTQDQSFQVRFHLSTKGFQDYNWTFDCIQR